VAVVLLLLGPGSVSAQERSRPGAGSVLDLAVPERAAAARIRAEARARLVDAMTNDTTAESPPDVLREQASARYDAILQVFPNDVDALIERGLALAQFERVMADGHQERRIDEAIASLERAREVDPTRDAATIASELAVLRTRRQEHALAAGEYERALAALEDLPLLSPMEYLPYSRRERGWALLFLPPSEQTLVGNWAEVTMLAGDPTSAIDRYRRAFALAETSSITAALALWGLALAQERSGSHADAIETVLRAIDVDETRGDRSGTFAMLHQEGVFFEPACEIHAYESLGHEALARRASTAEGRAREWTAARLSARFFLAEGGAQSIYRDVAVAAEARLTALLAH